MLFLLRWKYRSGCRVEALFWGLNKSTAGIRDELPFCRPPRLQPLLWEESEFSYWFHPIFIYFLFILLCLFGKRARLHQALGGPVASDSCCDTKRSFGLGLPTRISVPRELSRRCLPSEVHQDFAAPSNESFWDPL